MSSYKHSHVMDNGLVYNPDTEKTTIADIMNGISGVADAVHDNWYALPADMRYNLTGNSRALEEAIADGSLNPDGTRTMDIEGFKQWRAMGNTGDYQDYKYEQNIQRIKKILKDEEEEKANAPVITEYTDPKKAYERKAGDTAAAEEMSDYYNDSAEIGLPKYYEQEAAASERDDDPLKAIDEGQEAAYNSLFSHEGLFDPVTASEDEIKEKQRELGLKDDGIWGPKSQAAYEKSKT